MTSDGVAVVKCLFETIWRLFTSWYIPGTNTTPAGFLIFALFMVLTLRVMKGLVPGLGALDFLNRSGNNESGDSN